MRRYLRMYVLSNTPQKVEIRLKKIKKLRSKFKDKNKKIYFLINSLIKYKENIFAHLKIPCLPYTNNRLENLIKQYERRLKTIEGFENNLKATEGYLNLLGIYQCFKPYTDARSYNQYKNGKSPFPPKVDLPQAEELAGFSTKGIDWVRFALKNRFS